MDQNIKDSIYKSNQIINYLRITLMRPTHRKYKPLLRTLKEGLLECRDTLSLNVHFYGMLDVPLLYVMLRKQKNTAH